MATDPFLHWFEALERRHLASLSFPEVRRAVQALSSLYVERRERMNMGSAFSGAGKRAAFAMYFGPLHFLLVREIVRALDAKIPRDMPIMDLGCGTGVAGTAWSLAANIRRVTGIDRNSWAIQECNWTYKQLGIPGTAKVGDVENARIPSGAAIIAAFTMNEIDAGSRDRLRGEFIKAFRHGAPILIVEPIARRALRWWDDWSEEWTSLGGRADEWRFRVDLPERLALMDKASGLDHRELTGRSLWLPPSA